MTGCTAMILAMGPSCKYIVGLSPSTCSTRSNADPGPGLFIASACRLRAGCWLSPGPCLPKQRLCHLWEMCHDGGVVGVVLNEQSSASGHMGSSRSADSVTVKIYMAMVRPRRSIAYVLNSGDIMSWIACCMRRLHEVRSVAAWLRTEVVSARAATNTATTPAREQQGAG